MPDNISNLKKDPEDWKTGNERPTDAQISYITTMAQEAGVEVEIGKITKAQAAELIEQLQKKTHRGQAAN
jgi:hypothetical protein